MNSIRTSQIKHFPQASGSIASNAENVIRLRNARENFENTATSGKKRTHAFVFNKNHKNDRGRYVRYYRSRKYAYPSNSNSNVIDNLQLHQNPYTREYRPVKVARFRDNRKIEFKQALDGNNANKILRILKSGYDPPSDLAHDAIRIMACRPGGVRAIELILKSAAQRINGDVAYGATLQCGPERSKTLVYLFRRNKIKATPDMMANVIHHGLEQDLISTKILEKILFECSVGAHSDASIVRTGASRIMARVFELQGQKHQTTTIPPRLKSLLFRLRTPKGDIYEPLLVNLPHPGRLIKWLFENVNYYGDVTPHMVYLALHVGNLPVAVYLLSKKTTRWREHDKTELLDYLQHESNLFSKDPRKKQIVAIIHKILNRPAPVRSPKPPVRPSNTLTANFKSLQHGNVIAIGRLNGERPVSGVAVSHPKISLSHITNNQTAYKILRHPQDTRHPPVKVASQANLNKYFRQKGIFRSVTRNGSYIAENPLVPPPRQYNYRNTVYKKANLAARKIQNAWKRRGA